MDDSLDLADRQVSSVGEIGTAVLSAYDLVVDLGSGISVEIGRFSQSALGRIVFAGAFPADGPLLKVGSFCEFGLESTILLGSNHANSSLFNFTFGQTDIIRREVSQRDFESCFAPPKPTRIEDCVLFSYRTTTLSGSHVGTGSIIGASATLAGKYKPYGVYGGVPAKLMRMRFDERMQQLHSSIRIWDVRAHDVSKLPKILSKLAKDQISISDYFSEISHLKARPTVHLTGEITKSGRIAIKSIDSYSVSGRVVTDEKIRSILARYFSQALTPNQQLKWTHDIFHLLGLD